MLSPESTADPDGRAAHCPSCSRKGKRFKPVTIRSLLVDQALSRATRLDGFYFCAEPRCEVAYFQPESGERFLRVDVHVRIGQKEMESPKGDG